MDNLKKPIVVSVVTALTLLAAACNTVEGVGQDVESVGEKVEESAK